jgi:hypothetical protein
MMRTTTVAGRRIPIDDGVTTICFSRGRQGLSEAGPWEFWTLEGSAGPPFSGRCRPGDDPGKRFREIEQRSAEAAKFWPRVQAARRIRPATKEEVEGWLNNSDHADDMADLGHVDGRTMRVVKRNGQFRFE